MEIRNKAAFRSPPSCVLLDLDNTFYAYDPAHRAGMAAVETLVANALNLGARDFNNCFDDARTELKARLGKTAASHHRLLYFQRTIERAGFSSQPLLALQMNQAYWRAFLNAATLFSEALEFLDDLRIGGIPAVIVTDLTAETQFRKIIHFGMDRLVDWIVTSEEVGCEKPSARNFELALAKLGGVEGTVWMVGEEPVSDIGGARAAVDAVTIQKRHAGVKVYDSGENAPDAVFDSFGELRRLLRDVTRG
ncbi:HAD family hydrolase [Sphingomonas sp. HITSZ_GF]|uniref:HAD family hydrolase n=1 Tax=Sphingomonas sp. HITSZ_GF TaxID=3037247 RepID=UPI00240E0027|nr:HAD family hydrolase [Sphingomonas sp. HITSZ_GF]MDG2535763.1 HAD family hydrolase [Sphingomonas sp. HITSZ_GF]